jgi:hypothetical protein
LQRGVVDGVIGGENPTGVEEVNLGEVRNSGSIVTNAAEFALIARR